MTDTPSSPETTPSTAPETPPLRCEAQVQVRRASLGMLMSLVAALGLALGVTAMALRAAAMQPTVVVCHAPVSKPVKSEPRAVAFLGIQMHAARVLSEDGNSVRGARIVDIADLSPAEAAELQSGDVITHIDGRRICGPRSVVHRIQRQKRPGDALDLSIVRDGESMTVHLTLGNLRDFPAWRARMGR